MIRAVHPAKLLARLEGVAALVESARPLDTFISDALHLAASSCLTQPRSLATFGSSHTSKLSDAMARRSSGSAKHATGLRRSALQPFGCRWFASSAQSQAADGDSDAEVDWDADPGDDVHLDDEEVDALLSANVYEIQAGRLAEKLEQRGEEPYSAEEEARMRAAWERAEESFWDITRSECLARSPGCFKSAQSLAGRPWLSPSKVAARTQQETLLACAE